MTMTHEDFTKELIAQFSPVLQESPDGVYLWLDDGNKFCNHRLATMFGYTVDEWSQTDSFLETFIDADDRDSYAMNYQSCVATLAYPVTFRFRAVRKDGSTFAAETDMIPIVWRGHPVAYHFVRQTGE